MKAYIELQHFLKFLIATILLASLAFSGGRVFALGLGDLTHESYIGQPFKGAVELVGADEVAPENIVVEQVSQVRAAELGIDLISLPYRLQFEPVISNGVLRSLRVTSRDNIYEPYLSIVVELKWPSGAVFREYAVLMDTPPQRPVEQGTSSQQTISQLSSTGASVPTQPVSLNEAVSESISLGASYTVQPGDTLSGIVSRIEKPEGVSNSELVNVVFNENRSAFINENINQLKAGAELAVPSAPAIQTQSRSTNESAPVSQNPASSESIADQRALQSSAREGRLSLSDGGKPEKGADYDVPQIREQIDGTQEMIDMLVRENQDLRDRIDQIENSDYLTTLSELVAMQRRQIDELREEFRAQVDGGANSVDSSDQDGTSVAAPLPVIPATSSRDEPSLSQKLAQNFWSFISLVVVAFIALIGLCIYAVKKLADGRKDEAEYTQYRESIESNVDFVGIKESADIDADIDTASNVTTIESAINSRRRTPLRERLKEREQIDKTARDAEVKERIRQKTDEYNSSPSVSQSQAERHKVGVNLVMGLDEEVNELLSMAKIYCSAGKYSEARAILNAQNREGSDPRLLDALEQIDRLEQEAGEENG